MLLGYKALTINAKSDVIDDYSKYSLWLSLPLYFTVANYQYERIWMVNLIIILITTVRGIKVQQINYMTIPILITLLAITIAAGTFSKLY